MASAQPSAANTNGSYLQQADPQSFPANPPAAASVPNYQTQQGGAPQQPSANPEPVPKDEVGWYFVEQYYTTLNKTPERLHLFYNKRSSFVWGTEGELLQLATGRNAIQEKIHSYEFKDCKVRVSNVDSQASADNGIVIQVLGEMSNNGLPNRKFSQTFFLAEQPNGYYVLNDIFRYLKDDEDTEEGEDYDFVEDPATEAVVGEAVAIAVDEIVDEIVEQMEDLTTKETTTTEIEIEGDKVKIEETVIVEPALPVPEPQGLPPPANGNNQPVNGDSPVVEPEHQSEPELELEPEPEPEPEPQVEEPALLPPPPPVVSVEDVPPPPTEEEKSAPPSVKEPERAPTPVAIPKPAPAPVPAKPKTWANLVAANNPPPTPTVPATTPTVQTRATSSQSTATGTATAPNTPATPGGGSQWQTADSKRHSRVTSVSANATASPTSAYVKNVSASVTEQSLKDALSKFGPLKQCEIIRAKSCAFVEFETPTAFAAAYAASPHKVGESSLIIEERRTSTNAGSGGRGPAPGRDSRPGGQSGRGGGYQRPEGGLRGDGRGTTGGRGPRGGFYPTRGGATRTNTAPSGTN